MTDEIDYYTELRDPAYNSAPELNHTGIQGKFDPLNALLLLENRIANILERGDRPEFGVVEAGDPELLAFSTYLHEIIHWWQHVGTTTGLICGLSIPVQANATAFYLDTIGDTVKKPLLYNLESDDDEDESAVLAVTRWLEVEYGASFLLNHRLLIPRVRRFKYFESAGYCLLMTYANTIATLNTIFDPNGQQLPTIGHFLDCYQKFSQERFPDFVPKELLFPALSSLEIMEGQARISELQFRSLTYEPLTWAEITERGYLRDTYGIAFETYLSLTQFPEPHYVQEPVVNLFLLICEIALNPGQGYATDISPDSHFVQDVHPGHRFLTLCMIAKSEPSVLDEVKSVSLSGYHRVCDTLCSQAGWDTPVEIWKKILAKTGAMLHINELDTQLSEGVFDPENVPIRFYFAEHRSILETKIQIPHFFCWPGYYLVHISDDHEEAESIQEILRLHQPPFESTSLTVESISVRRSQFTSESKAKFVSDYFGSQVLYDLVRQWISQRGNFRMKYLWKPNLTEEDRTRLEDRFFAVFRRHLGSIPIS